MGHSVLLRDVRDQPIGDRYVLAFDGWLTVPPIIFFLLSVLLVYRIWYIDHKVTRLCSHQNPQLRRILHVIIDTGAIYSLSLLAAWICFSRQSYGQFVVQDMVNCHSLLAYQNDPIEMIL